MPDRAAGPADRAARTAAARAERAAREAAALRENLRRRKDQARARAAGEHAAPADAADDAPPPDAVPAGRADR